MGSRGLVAFLVLIGGVVGGYLFYAMDFESTQSITVQAPSGGLDRGPLETFVVDDARLACTSDGYDHYVGQAGGPMFFNGATPTYPDPRALCTTARRDRFPASTLIAVAGLLAAVLILATGPARVSRRADADAEADGTDAAPAPGARPGSGTVAQ